MKIIRTTILASLVIGFTTTYAQTSISPNTKLGHIQIFNAENIRQNDTTLKANINSPGAIAAGRKQGKVIVITGTRFAYPLIQKWIDDYNQANPDIQIII